MQHDITAFRSAYGTLNAAQKQAVDTIEGPVMVIAGPGTGKTQILTLRIANILLQTDAVPESILALTFTESGATAMRERLRRYVGAEAYRVPIYTFHGFAERLIREYPDAYPHIIGGRPASDLDRIAIIESILEHESVTILRPMGNPSYYVTPIIRQLSDLKREYVSPERLRELIAAQETTLAGMERVHAKGAHAGKVRGEYRDLEKVIEKNRALTLVYQLYEQQLRARSLYDFEDMIVETVAALESNEDMLRDLQERYLYVLADEHQDVNASQNRILEVLCDFHERPNIFVVGDEKQAIYRFQGASLDNFLFFEDRFKNATTIALTDNYRSGQSVLDVAHSLIAIDDPELMKLRVPLTAAAVLNAEVTQQSFTHQAVEDAWVVEAVEAAIAAGVSADEVAVIVRTNREVEVFSSMLRKAGVPVHASAEGNLLEHSVLRSVEALINFVLIEQDESALFAVLQADYWGISTDDLIRICSARTYNTPLSRILSSEALLADRGVTDVAAAVRVMDVQREARTRDVSQPPHRVLEYVLNASGLLEHLMQHDPFEGVRVVRRLYDEIEALVLREEVATLREVRDMLSMRRRYSLPLSAPFIAVDTAAVSVLTAHKSKGLEFNTVFIPHLADAVWGGSKRGRLFTVPLSTHVVADDVADDERRLLYVAMTRAKEVLHLSHATTNSDGKDRMPTRLLDSIDTSLVKSVSTVEREQVFEPIASLVGSTDPLTISPETIVSLLAERGFSATSLNNYLESPWNFLYRNILRIPEVQSEHLLFGTAMHAVLEKVTKLHTTTGTLPSTTELKALLEHALGALPLTTTEFTRLHAKGLEALVPYVAEIGRSLPATTREEFSVRVLLPTGVPELPELPLTGSIDRLDLAADGTAIRVVDYKTGKPKSRNVIEGNTKSANGNYKRQLVFYALLLSLYGDERFLTRNGTLSFVQPDAKGGIREESFTITDSEITALKETLIAIVKDVCAGTFLDAPTGDSNYQHLADELRRRLQ